jgi:sulfur relay (sulfurtransferase) complex TusBCD TusD component (DsrE family)
MEGRGVSAALPSIDMHTTEVTRMNVAYIFTTAGQTIHYILGGMILPQLEENRHGATVAGMFFFHDNTFALRAGDPLGERLGKVAREQGMLLMLCDQCAAARGLAEKNEGGGYTPRNVVEGVQVGCFPDLYAALGSVDNLQVISL